MKTIYFIGLAIILIISFSCKKDPQDSDCERLEGIWTGQSWKEDTVQFLGSTLVITSTQLTFKVLTGDQGDYEWNTVNLISGPNMVIGSYVVNESCDEVTLTPKGQSDGYTYDFHFEGNLLFMERDAGSTHLEILLIK